MDCPNCGTVIYDSNQKFCEKCGFELNMKVEEKIKTLKPRRKLRAFSRRKCC